MRVIGLMSGTSYDAVDAAADLDLVGDTLTLKTLGPISRRTTTSCARRRPGCSRRRPPPSPRCRPDTRTGQAFAALAVEADQELCDGRAELVASHGQTVYHWTGQGRVFGTLQLGQPAWIAEATGLLVVADFRPRDIAGGGQGAPW